MEIRIGLVITRGDEFGGAQLHLSYIAQYLLKKGYHVEVITGTSGVFTDHLRQHRIPVTRLARISRSVNFINDLLAIWALIRTLYRRRFNLIAAHSSKAGIIATLAARWTNTPVIFTAHSWPFLQGKSTIANWSYRVFSYLTCHLADHIICVCSHDLSVVQRSRFIKECKFSMIHNGIPDLSSSQCSTHSSHTPKTVGLVMVARLAPPKDPRLLLRVMPYVDKAHLTLVGDGPERNALEALCDELQISDRVEFVGESPTPEIFIGSAEIVLLITRSEGLPLSVLEGMRAGKPVIATAVGGIPEIIEDGKQGFLVESDNQADLASKLQTLVTDIDLRLQMGKRARKTYESRFLDQEMLNRTHAVYQDILQASTDR